METNKAKTSLQQFNETIGKWISCLDNYTLEMLCRKPQAASWSLGQVYRHIINETEYYIEQIKICLSHHVNSEKEMSSDAKVIFANHAFPDVLIAGSSANDTVQQPLHKDELLTSLLSIKEEMNKRCLTVDFQKSTGKTQHPELLFFNALEWLQFAEIHMRHHFRQKKRIDDFLYK